MKKILIACFCCMLLSGCIGTKGEDYTVNYDFIQNYNYDEETIYTYNLLKESMYDHKEYDKLHLPGLFDNMDEEQVLEDVKKLDKDAIINNMQEYPDVNITKYDKPDAKVYLDKNVKEIMVIKDNNNHFQVYNPIPEIPQRYKGLIDILSDKFVFAGTKINNQNTDRVVLQFYNTEMYIIHGDSIETIYSTDYNDMDMEYINVPMSLELYMEGDNIAKINVATYTKDKTKTDNEKNCQMLSLVPEYGEALAEAYNLVSDSSENINGKSVNMEWNYLHNIARDNKFDVNMLICDVE